MRRLASAASVVLVLLAGGCGAATPSPGAARGLIDAHRGTYRGVRLGMSVGSAAFLLGPVPTNDNEYLPIADRPPFLPADNPYDWVFADEALTFVEGQVASMTIYGRGALTERGVGVGQPLAAVSRAYPSARCLPDRGGSAPVAAGCQVRVTHTRFVYFSGDPIRAIALTDHTAIP